MCPNCMEIVIKIKNCDYFDNHFPRVTGMADEESWDQNYVLKPVVKLLKSRKRKISDAINLCKVSLSKTKKFEDIQQILCAGDLKSQIDYLSEMPSTPKKGGSNLDWGTILSEDGLPTNEMPPKEKTKSKITHQVNQKQSNTYCTEKNVSKEASSDEKVPATKLSEPYFENVDKPKNQMPAKITKIYQKEETIDRPFEASMPKNAIPKKSYFQKKKSASPPNELPPPCPELPSNNIPLNEHRCGSKSPTRPIKQPFEKRKKIMDPDIPRPASMQPGKFDPQKIRESQRKSAELQATTSVPGNIKPQHRRRSTTPPITVHKYTPSRTYQKEHLIREGEPMVKQGDSKNTANIVSVTSIKDATEQKPSNHHNVGLEQANSATSDVPTSFTKNQQQAANKSKEASELKADKIDIQPKAVTTSGQNPANIQVLKPTIVETKHRMRSIDKKQVKKGAKLKNQDQETEDGKPKELEFEYREEPRLYIKPPKVPLSKDLTDNARIVEKDVVPANVPKNYRAIGVPLKPGEVQETYLMKLRTRMQKEAEEKALLENKSNAGQQQKEMQNKSTSVRGCKLTTQEPPKTELSDEAIAKKKEELKAEALRQASLVASKALQEVKKIFQDAENKFIPIAEEAISVDKTLKEGVINLIDTMSEEAISHSSDQNIVNEKRRSEIVSNLKKTNTLPAMNNKKTDERISEKNVINTALKKPPISTSTWDKKQNMNDMSEPADIYSSQRSANADHQVPTSIWGEISLEGDKSSEHAKFADKRQTESIQVEVLKQGVYESSDKNNSNSIGQNPLDKNKMHQNIPVKMPSDHEKEQGAGPAQNTEGKGHHGESNVRSNPNYLARRYATDLVRNPGPVTFCPPPPTVSMSGNPTKPPTRSPPSQTPPTRGLPTSGQGSDDGSGKDPPEIKVLLPSNAANQSVQATIKVEFQIVQDENSGQPKLVNEKIDQRDSISAAGAKIRTPGAENPYVNLVSKDISSRKNKIEAINKEQQKTSKQEAKVTPAQQTQSSTQNQNEKFVTPNVIETVTPTHGKIVQKQVNEIVKASGQERPISVADVNVYYYDAESMDADERREESIKLANEGKRLDNDKLVDQGRIAMASKLGEETTKTEAIKLVDANLKEEAIKLAEKLRTEAVKLAEEKLKEEAMKLAEERRMIEEMKLAEENRKVTAAKAAEENRRAEESRLAEEKKIADALKLAEEKKTAEALKLAEERKQAEALKLAEERKQAEALKLAEEKKQAEALKLAEERKQAEALKLAEERKQAEALKLAEEKKQAEALKLAEERKQAEALKLAEERKKAEALKLAEEQKKAEALKLAEERKKAEALKLAEERKQAEALKLAEERKKAEALKLAEEKKKAEALRLAEERKKAEALKLAEERKKAEALKLAEEQKQAEALKLAEERKKAEALRLAEERKKAEALKLVEERKKAEALKLAEERKKAEALKLAEEQKKAEDIRLAAEKRKAEAIKLAEERRKAEELKIALEKKKAEIIRLAAEKKKAEEMRLAEEKKRLEAFRLAEERRKLDEVKAAEEKKRIEAIKVAEEKWKAEAFKLSEEKRKVEALRASEERWRAEALKLTEDKRRADAIRLAEEKRRAVEIKFEQEKLKVESLRLSEEKWKAEAIKLAAEKQMAIANKIAEEKRQVEAARLAKEEEKARALKLAEDKRKAEAFRKAEEARKIEEKRIAEAFKLAEEKRKAEELEQAEQRKKAEAIRLVEEKRKAEEIKRFEEKKKAEAIRLARAEEIRLADEKKRIEAAKLVEEKRKAEEMRLAAEKKAAEALKVEEERKRAEALRLAEEKRREEEIKIAEGGKKAAMQKLAQEKKKEEEAKLAEENKKAEAIRIAEEKWKAEVVKRAEDKRLLEQIRATEERRRAEAEKLAVERQKAEERKIVEETKRMEAMKLAEAKKKEEIRKFNEGKYKVKTVAEKRDVKKFEHVKEDEREVITKLSKEKKERVDQATNTDKEYGRTLETAKVKNEQSIERNELSESDKKRRTEALKLAEVKRNAEAIKQAEQRSKAEAVKAAAEAKLNEEKRKREEIKAADLKKKQEYLVLIEKKRKAQAANRAEEIKKDTALRSDNEKRIPTKTSTASTILPAYEGKKNSQEVTRTITKKVNTVTPKSIAPNIAGESALVKKVSLANANRSSNSKSTYRPMTDDWAKNLPPSADAGPFEKGIGTFYDWTTPSSLARKAALHMELPIHRQGQRRLDSMKRDMSIKSANKMYQMCAPCKTNLPKPATPCPVCPDAPPPSGGASGGASGAAPPPGNPPPPGNAPPPPGDLPPRPSSSVPQDSEPIRTGPAQLTGISKYFNSQTISGRANVAKATFALMGLYALNRMMKKPSKESKPHAKR